MKSKLFVLLLLGGIVPVCALRSETADSLRNGKTYPIGEVVVTGTRHETDVRHLPMTISVVGRQKIVEGFQPSLLPTLTEQIPGLFVTGRGIMGYGVSGGAAGQMTLRGVGGGPTLGQSGNPAWRNRRTARSPCSCDARRCGCKSRSPYS